MQYILVIYMKGKIYRVEIQEKIGKIQMSKNRNWVTGNRLYPSIFLYNSNVHEYYKLFKEKDVMEGIIGRRDWERKGCCGMRRMEEPTKHSFERGGKKERRMGI
jgi:hypothetical protein